MDATKKSTEAWIEEGVQLLELRRFHDAHHAFEQPWRHHVTPLRLLCQALVQVAAAGHHLSRGRRRPAVTLIRRALPKLAGFVPMAAGLRLDRLVADLERLVEVVADPARLEPGELGWPRLERAAAAGCEGPPRASAAIAARQE